MNEENYISAEYVSIYEANIITGIYSRCFVIFKNFLI